MKENIKQNVELPMIIGIFLVGICFFLIWVTSFLYFFGVSVTPFHLLLAIFLSLVMCFLLSNRSIRTTLIATAVGLLIICVAGAISSYGSDLSWDGNAYHKPIVAFLRYGWNPLRETFYDFSDKNFPFLSSLRYNFLDAYPKGSEIIAACFYSITGKLESGKIFNLLSIAGVMCVCEAYLIDSANLKVWQAWIGAIIFTIHPVSIAQVFSYYNDGFLWQMVLTCTAACLYLLFDEEGRYKYISLFLIFASINIGFNIKFSGVIFFALPCAGLFFFWAIRLLWKQWTKKKIWKVLQGGGFFAVTVLSGFLFSGSTSYVINTIRHKNPFYSIIGKGANEIIESMLPAAYKDTFGFARMWKALFLQYSDSGSFEYKVPFLFSSASVGAQSYDQTVGGWGILFSELLIFGLLVMIVVWIRNLRKRTILCQVMGLFVFLGVIAVAVVPGLWWPRYFVAPLYIPACAVIALFVISNRNRTMLAPFAAGCFVVLCLINVAPSFSKNANVLNHYKQSRYEWNRMRALSASEPIKVTFNEPQYNYTFYGLLFDLMDNNITNYVYVPEYEMGMHAVNQPFCIYYSDPDKGVWAADNLVSYIEQAQKMENTALLISVKDEASSALTEDMIHAMRGLGLEFNLQYRGSYLAVVDNGKVQYEKTAGEKISYSTVIGQNDISLVSAGYLCGDTASICVEGMEYAVNERGINIVLVDTETGIVLDSVSFDTFESGVCVRR